MKKQQSGFTLIELIMVIVILGILSAFALPKFADLSGSAEQAAIEGALASVKSASAIAHASALVNNATGATGSIPLEDGNISGIYGYPAATAICDAAGLDGFHCTNAAGVTTISLNDGAHTDGDVCFTYTQAADATTPPVYSAVGSISSSACS